MQPTLSKAVVKKQPGCSGLVVKKQPNTFKEIRHLYLCEKSEI